MKPVDASKNQMRILFEKIIILKLLQIRKNLKLEIKLEYHY